MIARAPMHHQSAPTPAMPPGSCSRYSANSDMQDTLSSNTHFPLPMNPKIMSWAPIASAARSHNKRHPGQPPLLKTPQLYIPDLDFCRMTSNSTNDTPPTSPEAQIVGVPNDCLTEPVSEAYQPIPPQTDKPIEALSQGSSEILGGPSSQAATRELFQVTNAPHNVDSQPDHSFNTILMTSPKIDHKIRRCTTPSCNGLIVPSSTCLRCVQCIKADWKARKTRYPYPSSRPRSELVSILRTDYSEKGKQKSVSWADQQNDWISRIKRVHLRLPEPPPPPSTDKESPKLKSRVLSESPRGTRTAPKQKEFLSEDSCLWDSDLTELTESSDDSDSETEESELSDSSNSEETSDSEPESELPKLIIRIPARRPSSAPRIPPAVALHRNRPLPIFTPYPEYRCQHELLADFHARLSGFQDALSLHSLYMQPTNRNPKSVFGFEGQYSVVAPDWDLFGRSDSIRSGALDLKEQLGRLGMLEFEKNSAVTTNDNGIFTRFLCIHRFYDPLGPLYADQQPKTMDGELEIAALPDSSHHILPGQKFVIRFRMIG